MRVIGVRCASISFVASLGCAFPAVCNGQATLGVEQAIDLALEHGPALKAEAERVASAHGLREQAGKFANPEILVQNENLRPGQTYTRDVDTLAYVTQPLDIFGKRGARIALADRTMTRAEAEYAVARLDTIRRVSLAYWTARGAQETRDLLNANAGTLQRIVDYHDAQLRVGTIVEQDVLRVRLERERLNIAVNLADLAAARTRWQLMKEIGDPTLADVVLSDTLTGDAPPQPEATLDQVLAQHPSVKMARAALSEAQARSGAADLAARPDLAAVVGYKRTLLPDATRGVNTAVAGISLRLPVLDRNQGNRAAAAADVRRAQDLLDTAIADVRIEFETARQDYERRHAEVVATLGPLRDHAAVIANIAQAAYTQAGTDLLRLLDAERMRIDADTAWVQAMVEYRQSIATLIAASGVVR